MARFNNPLAGVHVAAPCRADWNQMMGDERVRFCSECNLNVYSLSAMTRSDAESLIVRNEGRLCVKFLPAAGRVDHHSGLSGWVARNSSPGVIPDQSDRVSSTKFHGGCGCS